MSPATATRIETLLSELIVEGEEVCKHSFPDGGYWWVQTDPFSRWNAKCRNLAAMLGPSVEPWKDILLKTARPYRGDAQTLLGTLRGVADTIKSGSLLRLEQLVRAEAFSDLLDQADYLLSEGYFLAAGVITRAVLEDHLRNWCAKAGCSLGKSRPTLNDYNTELYKAKHIDKLTWKHVEAMTAVGNNAAHNDPGLQKADVERLVRDVRDFLVRYP